MSHLSLSLFSYRSGILSKTVDDSTHLTLVDEKESNDFFGSLANNEGKIKYNGFKYNNDGSLIAVLTPNTAYICTTDPVNPVVLHSFESVGNVTSQDCYFSPKNSYFVTYQTHGPKSQVNFKLWNLKEGKLEKSWTVRRRWCWPLIQWDCNETTAIYLSQKGTLQFFTENNWQNPSGSFNLAGLTEFNVSPGPEFIVLLFVTDSRSYITLHKFPDLDVAIARKTFAQADKIDVFWSGNGKMALCLTFKEVDDISNLYSGRSAGLYLLRDDGFDCLVQIKDNLPIQSIVWNPKGNQFAAIYGFVPECTTGIFDFEANAIAQIDSNSKNALIWSPCGRILAIGGFGNLPGDLDFYDVSDCSNPSVIGSVNAFSTTYHTWSPDSKYFIGATLSPRLRVDNCIRFYSYRGDFIHQENIDELYEIRFKPTQNNYPQFKIEKQQIIEKPKESLKSTKYIPPKRISIESKGPIGGTLVGGKKTNQNQNQQNQNKGKGKGKGGKKGNQNNQDNQNNQTNQNPTGGGKPENRIKNILKKLVEIEKLKERLSKGEALEKNQIDKINSETKLRSELLDLENKIK
jgi:translation initiation factor 2A